MKKFIKILVIIIIIIIICLVGLYNLGTSQYCIKKYFIPMAAEMTNSKISVTDINVSLMSSSVLITDLYYVSPELSIRSDRLAIKASIYDFLFNKKINLKKFLLENTSIEVDLNSKSTSALEGKNASKQQKRSRDTDRSSDTEIGSTKKRTIYEVAMSNINIKNLNVVIKNNDTITKFNKLNLSIPNIEQNKKCSIKLDSNISLTDGAKFTEGFIRSNSVITVNNNFIPTNIDSSTLIEIGSNKMPLNIKLKTDDDEKFNLKLKLSNIMIKPFVRAFITGIYGNTVGGIKDVTIKASGKNINDFKTGANPINMSVDVTGVDISSQNNFSILNKSMNAAFDLSSLIKGKVIPKNVYLNDFSSEYTKDGQTIKINELNIKLHKNNKNQIVTQFSTGFDYNKDTKKLKGITSGDIILTGNNILNPESINSKIALNLNGNNMPIVVMYENNSTAEKIFFNMKNLNLAPFKIFIDKAPNELSGGISDINITLAGKGISSIKKGLKKNSNSGIITDLRFKNIKLENRGKYSADIPNININLDLNKIINNKYHVNSFRMDNSYFSVVKTSTNTRQKESAATNPSRKNPVVKTSAKTKHKPNKTLYDFELLNLNINNLKAEIIAKKKIIFTNVNINSDKIKSDKLSRVITNLNYEIDNNTHGTINTQNDILITSKLIPERFRSNIEQISNGNKSHSSIDLRCKQNTSDNKIPFSLKVEVQQLLLSPFISALVPIPYDQAKTNIDSLSVKMEGGNLFDYMSMNGTISSKMDDISIPISNKNDDIVGAILFPLQVIAGLSSSTVLKFVPGNVSNAMTKINNMVYKNKRIDFQNGTLSIDLNSGEVKINKFDFYGVPQSPVSELKASGSINLNNKKIDIDTKTIFAGLLIPLQIKGTLEKPKTNTAKLTAQILQANQKTIIKTGIDTTNTIMNTIDQIKGKNFSDLLENPDNNNKQSDVNSEKQNGDKSTDSKQQSIEDTISNVLDILGNSKDDSSSQNKNQKKSSNKNKQIKINLNKLLNF